LTQTVREFEAQVSIEEVIADRGATRSFLIVTLELADSQQMETQTGLSTIKRVDA
jgi:hypothetical protein